MVANQVFIYLFLFNLIINLIIADGSHPKFIRIGAVGPKYTTTYAVHVAGTHSIAAFLMAIQEINNKTDGVADHLLPSSTILFALRSPKQNFIQAVSSALELSESVFNGTGVLGVIGTSSTESTMASGQVFAHTIYNVPQISYGSQDSTVGHKDIYPYVLRTCPSDAHEGRVLADFIYHYFDWKTVTLFYSGDTYGNDIVLEFQEQAGRLGITIEQKMSFWSGIQDFSSIINAVKKDGGVLKVFVLLMKSADAGLLLEQGYNLGLFKTGTQILGTEYLATSATWLTMSKKANIPKIMKGVIAIKPSTAISRTSPEFLSFVKRWRKQQSSQWKNSDGITSCSSDKDDDGHTYLYKEYTYHSNTKLGCAGVNFQSMANDGSDIEDLALYAYDAAYTLAKGFHAFYYEGYQNTVNITGAALRELIINNISFVGVTGNVSFSHGKIGAEAYGKGDRLTGLDYNIINFNPDGYHKNVNAGVDALRTVGTWTSKNKFIPCDVDSSSQCSTLVYNTEDNLPPIDIAPISRVQMPRVMRVGLRCGAALALVLIFFFFFVVFSCSESRIIKAAQPGMLLTILVGATLASFRVVVATYDLTDATCIIGKWLGHLAFGTVFGAMIIKTWRVGMVVNSGMKRVKITINDIRRILLSGLALLCCYLLMDTFIGQPHQTYEEYFDGHYNVHLIKCANRRPVITTVLFILEGILLMAGGRLCWSTKNIPDAVNDAKYIAMSLYLIVFVCAVTFPIVYFSITPTPNILLLIMCVGFIVATIGVVMLMFGQKTSLLWQGADVDENFTIIKRPSSQDGEGNPGAESTNGLLKLKHKIRAGRSGYNSSYYKNVSRTDADGNGKVSVHGSQVIQDISGSRMSTHTMPIAQGSGIGLKSNIRRLRSTEKGIGIAAVGGAAGHVTHVGGSGNSYKIVNESIGVLPGIKSMGDVQSFQQYSEATVEHKNDNDEA